MSDCLGAVLYGYMLTLAAHYHVPPAIVLSVIAAESSCRIDALSGKGDMGLMQIRRGVATRGYDDLTDAELTEPKLNIKLGIRRLARAKRICGGQPEHWLSNYAGLKCGSSKYSRNVISGRPRADIPRGNVYFRYKPAHGMQTGPVSSLGRFDSGSRLNSEATGFNHAEQIEISSDRKRNND